MNPQSATAMLLLVADLDCEIGDYERGAWEPIKQRLTEHIGRVFPTMLQTWKMYALKGEEWRAVRDFNNPYVAAQYASALAHRNKSVYLLTGNGEQFVFGATYYLMHSVDGVWEPFECEGWLWVESSRDYALKMAQTQSKRQHDLWAVYQSSVVYRFPHFVNERSIISMFKDGVVFTEAAPCKPEIAF